MMWHVAATLKPRTDKAQDIRLLVAMHSVVGACDTSSRSLGVSRTLHGLQLVPQAWVHPALAEVVSKAMQLPASWNGAGTRGLGGASKKEQTRLVEKQAAMQGMVRCCCSICLALLCHIRVHKQFPMVSQGRGVG